MWETKENIFYIYLIAKYFCALTHAVSVCHLLHEYCGECAGNFCHRTRTNKLLWRFSTGYWERRTQVAPKLLFWWNQFTIAHNTSISRLKNATHKTDFLTFVSKLYVLKTARRIQSIFNTVPSSLFLGIFVPNKIPHKRFILAHLLK